MERQARVLRFVALAAAVLLPLLALIAMLAPESAVRIDADRLPMAWAGAVALLTSLMLSAGLVSLAWMLAQVEAGQVFAPAATRHFRGFARWVFLSVIAGLILPPLIEAGLALFAGGTHLHLGIDSTEFVLLLVTGVLLLVARLFDEAARLEEDSRSIV